MIGDAASLKAVEVCTKINIAKNMISVSCTHSPFRRLTEILTGQEISTSRCQLDASINCSYNTLSRQSSPCC